ncbi:MAG: SPOR domain-containing protein [Rhodospirillaceae bacterium]|nr:SPOR domain-containing protein [Rhodospirillaceae bacterium]
MIDDRYDDDLDRDGLKNRSWLATAYKWLVGVGAITAVVLGGVYLLASDGGRTQTDTVDKNDVPLIRAAAGPVKIRPADPGGHVLPHQNREVYRQFASAHRRDGRKAVVEDFLAPQKGRKAPGSLVASGPTCQRQPDLIADVDRLRGRMSAGASDAGRGGRNTIGGLPRDRKAAGSFRVQLGAFRSRTTAQRHWRGLKRKHASLLSQLNMMIERVDLGARGVFYRLQVGPMRAKRSARGLCRSLARRRVNCILVSG